MISRKFDFALLICIPLLWFFFYLMPNYLLPADCSTGNFIYAENLANTGVFTFDTVSNIRFDDSSNFLYVIALFLCMKFFAMTTFKAALFVNGMSLLLSVFFLHRAVSSRFVSVHMLMIGLFFMSTQIWAGVLGDEVLFQGLLYVLAIRSFWKHRYTWLLIWCVLNVMARPDNILYVTPLIIASYWDIQLLKDRDKPKFVRRRILKTFIWFVLPLVLYGVYREIYFGQVMPQSWKHESMVDDKKYWIFHLDSILMLKHYVRFFILPLFIGVAFYFIKEFKQLHARYHAILIGFVIMPVFYTCTFLQDENLGFKNYYPIYIGLMTLSLLFIRDFRSISQAFFTGVFVFFFGFPNSIDYFIKTLQKATDNLYVIAGKLNAVPNGKAIVYYDNFITWRTDWQTTFANSRHTPPRMAENIGKEEMRNTDADVIFVSEHLFLDDFKEKYDLYDVPQSTRQYQRQQPPDNSIDRLFYEYTRKYPVRNFTYNKLLVWKFGNNYKDIVSLLEAHGSRKIEF